MEEGDCESSSDGVDVSYEVRVFEVSDVASAAVIVRM